MNPLVNAAFYAAARIRGGTGEGRRSHAIRHDAHLRGAATLSRCGFATSRNCAPRAIRAPCRAFNHGATKKELASEFRPAMDRCRSHFPDAPRWPFRDRYVRHFLVQLFRQSGLPDVWSRRYLVSDDVRQRGGRPARLRPNRRRCALRQFRRLVSASVPDFCCRTRWRCYSARSRLGRRSSTLC